MGALKVLQFAFPVVWVCLVLRERIEWRRLSTHGVATGLLFGLAVAVAGWFVFQFVLADSPLFVAATEQIRAKVAGFGLDSVAEIRGTRRLLLARPLIPRRVLLAVVRVRPTAAARAALAGDHRLVARLHGPPRARAVEVLRLVDCADAAPLGRGCRRRGLLGVALRPQRLARSDPGSAIW